MNHSKEFWNVLSLFAAATGIMQCEYALEQLALRQAKMEEEMRKAHAEKRAAGIAAAISQLKAIEAAIATAQADYAVFKRGFSAAHTEVFRPAKTQFYNDRKNAQVIVRVGSKSYTRHLKLVNGAWRGNAIIGSGMMDYRLSAS